MVEGEAARVDAYLAQGGDPARALAPHEVALLDRASAFDAGHTLVHLAIRYRRPRTLTLAGTDYNTVNIYRCLCPIPNNNLLIFNYKRTLDYLYLYIQNCNISSLGSCPTADEKTTDYRLNVPCEQKRSSLIVDR